MTVVIVESPSKAKTINKYLGSKFDVVASFGHVRDLPSKDGSVDPDSDFSMIWEMDAKSSKRMSDIAKMVKDAGSVILATDPDREGEAISWHLLEILRAKKVLKDVKVSRVTFNAITKQAVEDAMKKPRDIDQALVDAYLARRAMDYLVGFRLSPVLWRKLPGARSAGRVQSVALRIVCEREMDIETFVKREYWSLSATLANSADVNFEARLVAADGKKITRLDIGGEAEALAFKAALETAKFSVASVEAKPAKRYPYPPFTTSTLQQEASRKLGIAPAQTMRIAQKLYEGADIGGETVGLITYMRTDGVQMDGSAINAVRKYIGADIGDKYVPKVPRAYTTKAKNAQEAHEAIRPTDVNRTPEKMRKFLDGEAYKLYELIWKRTVASQMENAEFERTTADIEATVGTRHLSLRAVGQVMKFDGFLNLYTESKDDEEDEDSARLPALSTGEMLTKKEIRANQHSTEPPPRFTEASLVKRMEELGIGRPSTYAATIAVLVDREYVSIDKKRLIGEDKGRLVTAFLEGFFKKYVEYDFTADLENQLDRISNNEIDWKQVLRDFWTDFSIAIDQSMEKRTTDVLNALNDMLEPHLFPGRSEGNETPRACPRCGTGSLSLKLSRTGPFIGCENYPECKYTRPFAKPTVGADGETPAGDQDGNRVLGIDPVSGMEVTLRDGRFGPYVQLGDGEGLEKGEKPKRQSVPKGLKPADMDLKQGLLLLSLPRTVGLHPESGEPILASIGRYGPYVQHGKTYANVGAGDDVLTIGINRAVDLIITKETEGPKGRFGRAATAVPAGRVLGDHPDGGAVTVRDGKYGPYVNWGKVNATLSKSIVPDELALDEALVLIQAKLDAGGGTSKAKAKPKAKPAAKTKPAAKPKTAAKKPAKTKAAV